ncbi:MAG: hypothetical protein JWR80_7902 [Bradyrhizobium sp.]|nr:hypothetical protein [Bradyrhizobium sp.]
MIFSDLHDAAIWTKPRLRHRSSANDFNAAADDYSSAFDNGTTMAWVSSQASQT